MCQDLEKVTFTCGHQVTFWTGKSRYCLFTGDWNKRFHSAYLSYGTFNDICGRCRITKQVKDLQLKNRELTGKGKLKLKGPEFRSLIEKRYAASDDGFEERKAAQFQRQAAADLANIDGEKMKQLTGQIKERIVAIMGRANVSSSAKVDLIRTITALPEVFNRGELVLFYASRYWLPDCKVRRLNPWEQPRVLAAVRRVGLERTLTKGLALKTAIPIGTLDEGVKGCIHSKKPQN